MLIWNGSHLHRVLTAFVGHYNTARLHRSLDLDVPTGGLNASTSLVG